MFKARLPGAQAKDSSSSAPSARAPPAMRCAACCGSYGLLVTRGSCFASMKWRSSRSLDRSNDKIRHYKHYANTSIMREERADSEISACISLQHRRCSKGKDTSRGTMHWRREFRRSARKSIGEALSSTLIARPWISRRCATWRSEFVRYIASLMEGDPSGMYCRRNYYLASLVEWPRRDFASRDHASSPVSSWTHLNAPDKVASHQRNRTWLD